MSDAVQKEHPEAQEVGKGEETKNAEAVIEERKPRKNKEGQVTAENEIRVQAKG